MSRRRSHSRPSPVTATGDQCSSSIAKWRWPPCVCECALTSRCRRNLSVRHIFASSTPARSSCPGYSSNFFSSASSSAKQSAVLPANPQMTFPPPMILTLRAFGLNTVPPIDTWPSPITTTSRPRRTARIVVPCRGVLVVACG